MLQMERLAREKTAYNQGPPFSAWMLESQQWERNRSVTGASSHSKNCLQTALQAKQSAVFFPPYQRKYHVGTRFGSLGRG